MVWEFCNFRFARSQTFEQQCISPVSLEIMESLEVVIAAQESTEFSQRYLGQAEIGKCISHLALPPEGSLVHKPWLTVLVAPARQYLAASFSYKEGLLKLG